MPVRRLSARLPFACASEPARARNPGLWQAELQLKDQPVTFNIAALDSVDLAQVFGHLDQNEKRLANLLKRAEIIQALAKHPSRPYWSSWDPIKALAKSHKVTITKKHTDCLDNYFCFAPQPLPRLCINTVSLEELSRHLNTFPLEIGKAEKLSHQLSGSPSRPYWRDFKDMTKALRDETQFTIPKATQTILAEGFDFNPELPPVPNTVPFLLQQMTVKELRREADERDLAHKEVKKKVDLVRLLSSD